MPDLGSPGDRNDSLAYTRNSSPSLGATFKVGDIQQNSVFEVKAFASNALLIPPIELDVTDGVATLPITSLVDVQGDPGKWANHIKIFRKSSFSAFSIDWSYQIDGGGWTRFATSMHQVYLTAAAPTVANNQETLFYYACNKPDGLSGASGKDVANQIFKDFKTLEMRQVDRFSGIPTGDFMTFWPGYAYTNVLRDGSGKCATWAKFFNDVLMVHGLTASTVDIEGYNIIFSDGPHDGSCWIPKGNPKIMDGTAPRSGQGHSSQAFASWPGHTISLAYGEYYDPSYGIGPASSKAEYEDQAVEWYAYPIYDSKGKNIGKFEPRIIGTGEKLDYK